MTEYALYLESGPKHRKTMVHVLELLGCMANGPTTEEALAATPAAIEAYRRFLHRIGERVDVKSPVTTRVAEHITAGIWLGNGDPYLMYAPDYEPVTESEMATFIARFQGLREALATWAESQTDARLDARADGRTARAILVHVLGTPAAYLSTMTGAVKGVSGLVTAVERGELAVAVALREVESLVTARLRETTAEERRMVKQRPKDVRTLRKAIRRILEHDWEHLMELSRRPGGPEV